MNKYLLVIITIGTFQDYALELFFRENWIDPRLDWDKSQFKNKSQIALHESYTAFLWHPDTVSFCHKI